MDSPVPSDCITDETLIFFHTRGCGLYSPCFFVSLRHIFATATLLSTLPHTVLLTYTPANIEMSFYFHF